MNYTKLEKLTSLKNKPNLLIRVVNKILIESENIFVKRVMYHIYKFLIMRLKHKSTSCCETKGVYIFTS